MRPLVLPLLCTALAAQPAPPSVLGEPSLRPAPAALAAKAPGHPAYGLEVTTPEGMFLLTHLRYDPVSPKGMLAAYRMDGPATWGPYRLGMELHWNGSGLVEKSHGIYTWSCSRFEIQKIDPNGPAQRAGLDASWWILQVDGRDFHWQDASLLYYATRRPTIDMLAQKQSGWGKGKEKHFQIQLQKLEIQADPLDANLSDTSVLEHVLQAIGPHLASPDTGRALAQLRARIARFAPIQVELNGRPWWVVRGDTAMPEQPAIGLDAQRQPRWVIRDRKPLLPGVAENQDRVFLEFWKENPAGDHPDAAPAFLCAEPSDHILKGRLLRLQDRWYRMVDAALEPADGRLTKLEVQPWAPDIKALLNGTVVGEGLGPGAPLADWSSLEQQANDDLLNWKIRKLPSILSGESLDAAEDLVFRLEKGMLGLDLKVRNLRAQLDSAARKEAEHKAQAELAARQGKPIPGFQAFPAAEVEQIASLLDQRKAILMAVLGTAKQALANLRR